MKKKIVLITGVNSGIGYAIAKNLLSDDQFFVIGISRTLCKLKSKNFLFIQFNLLSIDFSDLFKKINKITKYIDCFINNAGVSFPGNKVEDLAKTFETNVFAGFKLSKYFCELNMPIKRKLNLIHIGSISGKIALPNNISYNSSKAALLMLSKSFALDYSQYNVRSNSIILGYFPTKMTNATFKNKNNKKQKIKRTMLGRLGKLEEIFQTIRFLSSEKSSYMTAQEIVLDGGWSSKGL